MGLHVYCVVPVGHAPPAGLSGIGGTAVAMVGAGGLAAWVADLPQPPAATVADAKVHNRVIAAAMNDAVTPVPARFGQWLDTEQALREKLAADEAKWLQSLARFAGAAEYGVRVMGMAAPPAAAQDVRQAAAGTRYMLELAQRHAEAERRRRDVERITAMVSAAAGGLAIDARSEGVQDAVTVAHLVAWKDAADYHSAMRDMEARQRNLRFLFTGPWPPYSFVE